MRSFICFIVFALLASPAFAEERIALIIANSDYSASGSAFSSLANPKNDAGLMAEALERVGFEVHTLQNASRDQMERAFRAHADRLKAAGPSSTGLFFYAGHGTQSEGLNYLIPVDSKARTEADVWSDASRLDNLFRHLKIADNQRNFVILDACRDNPLLSSTRSGARGLAPVSEARGTLIAYATAPGSVALDGGEYSPYATALADLISQPGQPVETLFRRVRTRVQNVTNNRQRPWMESGLYGDEDFCFAGCESKEIFASDESTALAQAIQSGTLFAFQQFKKKFPGSSNLSFVNTRIKALTPARVTIDSMRSRSAATAPKRVLTSQEQAQATYEWQNDKQFSNSSQDLSRFLERYPTGSHVNAVNRRIQDLQSRGK